VSSVKHLFAPDIRAETLDFAQRVLMPVLVLRNHHVFNPLAPGHAHSIDLDHIRREAKSMVQDRQVGTLRDFKIPSWPNRLHILSASRRQSCTVCIRSDIGQRKIYITRSSAL
jgi:hypothetical protein